MRQLLLAAVAIGRGDAMAASILGSALTTARSGGFCNTVVTTAPEVTSYLIEHTAPARSDPFSRQLIAAAVQVRSAQPGIFRPGHVVSEQLTPAERRVLKLLPTSTCPQIAASLYVAQCTVKTHLRAIYQKRRDTVVSALQDVGLAVEPPLGSIYIWIPTPPGRTSAEFCQELLEEASVVVSPGNGYGSNGEGFVRISLTVPDGRLEEAMARIRERLG